MIAAIIGYMVSGVLLVIAALITFTVIRIDGRLYIANKNADPKVGEIGLFKNAGSGIFAGRIIAMEHDLVCTDDFSTIRFLPADSPSCSFFIFFSLWKEKKNGLEAVPPGNIAVLTVSDKKPCLRFVPAHLHVGKALVTPRGMKTWQKPQVYVVESTDQKSL